MKRSIALILVLVMMMSMFAGCSKSVPIKEVGTTRDTLTIGAYDEEWVAADLIQGDTFYDIQMMMAEPLFLYNHENGELEGCLCTTPTFSSDGNTMTFEVPEGRKFANGAILGADDVKASLEYAIKEGEMKDVFSIIKQIDVEGNKITLHMENYSTSLLILLVSPFFCVIDTEQLTTMTKDELLWGAQPYGAYYIVNYTAGSSVTMKRNPNFQTLNPTITNKGAAFIENIKVNWYTDEFAAIAAFKTGELQFLINMTEDGLMQTSEIDGVTVNSMLPPMVRNLQMNSSDPILKDENVRLAISYLIDRDNIVEAFGGSITCTPAYSYITKNVLFHVEETDEWFKETYSNDVEKGLSLLNEAGWTDSDGDKILDKDGKKLTLTFTTATGKNETAALAIQQQLQSYGFDIDLKSMTGSLNYEEMKNKNYSLGMTNYWWSEPGRFLVECYNDHNDFDETEYLAMAKEVETTTDNKLRFELVDKAQRYLMNEMVVLPLYTTSYLKVYYNDIGEVQFIVDGMFTNDCK